MAALALWHSLALPRATRKQGAQDGVTGWVSRPVASCVMHPPHSSSFPGAVPELAAIMLSTGSGLSGVALAYVICHFFLDQPGVKETAWQGSALLGYLFP